LGDEKAWWTAMATEEQYAFFKSLYDEENERTKELVPVV
jgi:hypothetical protein